MNRSQAHANTNIIMDFIGPFLTDMLKKKQAICFHDLQHYIANHIHTAALDVCSNNMTRAAELLGMNRTTLSEAIRGKYYRARRNKQLPSA